MNRSLPPEDRGNRSGTGRGQSRYRGVVPGAFGLVGRAAYPRKRKTPPELNPAARCERQGYRLGFEGVTALAVFAFGGNNGQAHFLPNRPGQEAADRMGLPSAGFLQFLGSYAARPLQQVEDLR